MSILQIRKKSLNIFLHNDSSLGDFYLSDFYVTLDLNRFQIVEKGQSKRKYYLLNEIQVFDDSTGGSIETFATWEALFIRLRDLGYTGIIYSQGYNNALLNLKLDKVTNQTTAQKLYAKNPDGSQTMIDVPSGGGGISGNLNQRETYNGGAQTITLPANSVVVTVTVQYLPISGWNVSGNTLTITDTLDVNDQIDIFGVTITSGSNITNYNNTFTYTGSRIFNLPNNVTPMVVTNNRLPIADFSKVGNDLVIGANEILNTNDYITVYGIQQ